MNAQNPRSLGEVVGEEEGEVGGTAEAGEDSGGEVIAEAGEASLPGEISLPTPTNALNMYSNFFHSDFFRGGGDNKRKTFDD